MANTTTTKKHQADADNMIAAAQVLERAARALKDRAKALRAGRSCGSTVPGSVTDLEWAEGDLRRGADSARAFLVEAR